MTITCIITSPLLQGEYCSSRC